MTTIQLLQKSIDYIEENLKSELSLSELAEISGFSTFHFCRIFSNYVGMPVAAFITKRRLYHGIYEIQIGKKTIDIALLYGFNTYAGFFKAFKREFGCSPTKYLKLNTAKKPMAVNLIREAKIMLTQREIKQILSNWNLDSNLEIEDTFTLGGTAKSDSTWLINGKYIFKTGKNIAGLKTHIAISKELEKSGVLAATPIKTIEDEDFIIKDDKYFCLTNHIKGKFLTPEERYAENRIEIGEKYGEAIGNLHKILKKQDKNLEVNDNNLLKTVLGWALPQTKITMEQWGCPLPDRFYEDFTENFSKLYNELPRHIIHRDPNPSNIMFHNDEVSGFIDFEISERNVRIFDPCYCATGILAEATTIADRFEKWDEILKGIITGYDNICKLTEAEKLAIPYVIYSIQMIFIAWLDGKEELKNLAMQNRKMLIWIWENKDKCFESL
ncbi:helix-turn-helix domain-containing protein [Tissierella carlieri]|uniref:Helix-turn-helix domain-containing protein n=1 Tax=Tissierella carlieri TaxID=689904 RepID=A0ABT1SA98_9FIRM|nr:helix-turn-helix domain-containing protein [Tissierella carlieri]MCQ4923411.1 helix-turn-helix domain-containing protein [Tissierella carlieri]